MYYSTYVYAACVVEAGIRGFGLSLSLSIYLRPSLHARARVGLFIECFRGCGGGGGDWRVPCYIMDGAVDTLLLWLVCYVHDATKCCECAVYRVCYLGRTR